MPLGLWRNLSYSGIYLQAEDLLELNQRPRAYSKSGCLALTARVVWKYPWSNAAWRGAEKDDETAISASQRDGRRGGAVRRGHIFDALD